MMIWRKISQIDFVERLTVSQYINSMEQSNETWSYSKISVKSTWCNFFIKKRWFAGKKSWFFRKNSERLTDFLILCTYES